MRERLLALRDHKSYNIVVFYVDTLRADFARNATLMPNVARFSAGALDFRRAYTTGSDTLHALPSIVGGSYDLYDQPDRDLFYYARSAGHRTALVAAKSAREFLTNLMPRFRFDDVTDVTDYADGRADVWGYGADQSTASRVLDRGLDWLQKHRSEPHLLWLFNFDLHNWREIDSKQAQHIAELHGLYDEKDPIWRYKALVRSIDAQFGRLLDTLEALDAAKDTVVLFVSDHGEGLGYDGFWVHSVFLWESLVHVPLLLRAPGIAPRRVDDVVSLVDVAPTLTRYLARRAETNHFHGHDLLEYTLSEHPRRRHPLVMMGVLNQVPVRLGVIDGTVPYKLVLPLEGAVPELYDLREGDPDSRDFSRERPEVVQHLLKCLVRAPTFPKSGVAEPAGASPTSPTSLTTPEDEEATR
jgi:arylsulfatase A-like enzyme